MPHSYKTTYPPSSSPDPAIESFFEKFYEVSDTPPAHAAYADSFTSDATFRMGVRTVQGRDDIFSLRKSMWDAVASRKHTVHKVFPFGDAKHATEFMLYGEVEYGFKDGREKTVEWAARAVLAKDEGAEGKWRFKFYQVYLDSAAMKG